MSTLRVFVVDPDEVRAVWLERIVMGHGHDVLRFENGERAIDAFVQQPADALLVEYVLPGRDGVATAEAIRWAPGGRDVRVLLLAREEPVSAPLHMLALRVDGQALVGELEQPAIEAALRDLEKAWDDEGTLALGDDSYARHLEEARRRMPSPTPAGPAAPAAGWIDVATVIAGAVRVETAPNAFVGEEPTTRSGDAAAARAIGIGPSPALPEDEPLVLGREASDRASSTAAPAHGAEGRPRATFDDVTTTEPGTTIAAAASAAERPLDASAARAILGLATGQAPRGARIVGRPSSTRQSGARFAAPTPSSSFRAPSSSSVTLPLSVRPSSAPPLASAEGPGRAAASAEPRALASESLATARRSEIATRQLTVPAEAPSAFGTPEDAAPARSQLPGRRREATDAERAATVRAVAQPAPADAADFPDDAALATARRLAADPQTVDEGRFVARAKASAASDWSGSFAATPFPALLRRVADERASGGLLCVASPSARAARASVDGEPPAKIVFFRGGVPVHVRSNLLDECLGQLLLRTKRIGAATLEESIRRIRQGGGLQGKILVEMGALSAAELDELLAEQARQKLFDLFGWRQGEFRFSSGMEPPRDGAALEMALPDIVYGGVCAAMPATLLLDIMTPRLEQFVVPDPARLSRFARVRVAKDLRDILDRVDGATRLRDVLRLGPRPGAIAQVLYALECLGAIAYSSSAEPRRVQLPPLSLEQPVEEPAVPPAEDGAWDDVTNQRARRASGLAGAWSERAVDEKSGPRAAGGDADGAPTHARGAALVEPDAPVLAPRATSSEIAHLPSLSGAALASDSSGPASVASTGPSPALSASGRALDAHVDRMFEAERCFRRGNRSLARSEHRDALAAFARAVELCPDEGEFVAYLGWARYCTDPASAETTEAALADLARSVELAPDLHLTHLLRARVLDHAGRAREAARSYREVIVLEPTMQEALDALARLDP